MGLVSLVVTRFLKSNFIQFLTKFDKPMQIIMGEYFFFVVVKIEPSFVYTRKKSRQFLISPWLDTI